MPEEPEPAHEKKIIIDEDWKTRVQAEKQQTSPDKQPADAPAEKPEPHAPRAPLPPASIAFLFSTIATQAFIALGFLPNPLTEKTELDVGQAKHFIDMLGVLEEKTRGNLTADEKRQLDAILFDLRMQFIELSTTANQPESRPAVEE